MSLEPKWLEWAKALQALAQTGQHFTENVFDRDRYQQIQAIAAEILSMYTAAETDVIQNLFNEQSGYATPKVDVRGAVFKDGRLLLVREKLDNGRWTLPGGWADVNDTPSVSAVREIYEESGYRARAIKLIAAWDRSKQGHPAYIFHVYKLYFLCELIDEDSTPISNPHDHETGEATFFSQADLPSDLSLARVTAAQLVRCFAHYHDPSLPTEFD